VRQRPDKVALYWGENEFTYQRVWQMTVWAGRQLQERFGVKKGDRVGIWLKNCPEFIPSFLGVFQAGAVVVPINNFLKAEEVGFILNDAGIDVLITDEELGTHHRALHASRHQLKLFRIEELSSADLASIGISDSDGAPLGQSDLAVLIYTSGTTGRPKGAMLSHGNLLHNVESCRIVLQTVEADSFAVMLPLFHSYMMTVGMLLPLLVGGTMVLIKSLHPVRNALQELFQRKATVLPAIPHCVSASAVLRRCPCRC
jgi:long-chain acyl-CoA synthetase